MSREPASENVVERSPRLQNAPGRASGTTWAERAWLLIGAYWIVLGIFVIPARLHEFKVGDVLLFGLAPIVVAIGLRVLGPNAPHGPDVVRGWTHTAAIALLVTWPLAWICLIVLGRSMRLADRYASSDACLALDLVRGNPVRLQPSLLSQPVHPFVGEDCALPRSEQTTHSGADRHTGHRAR